jgi:hypothetical protein
MRNNRSRAMSKKAKAIEPTSQHRPQIVGGVSFEIPEDCIVFAPKKKFGGRLGYHVNQIFLIHNVTNRVMTYNSRKIAEY